MANIRYLSGGIRGELVTFISSDSLPRVLFLDHLLEPQGWSL